MNDNDEAAPLRLIECLFGKGRKQRGGHADQKGFLYAWVT